MDHHFVRFIAGCCCVAIGIVHLVPPDRFFRSSPDKITNDSNDPVTDANFNNASSLGIGLLGLWFGVRLIQTVRVPDWWPQFTEMGWAYLIAMTLGALFIARGSWRSKWVAALGIIGCIAMYLGSSAIPHG